MKTLKKINILKAFFFFIFFSHFIFSCFEVSKFLTGSEVDFEKIFTLIILGLFVMSLSLNFCKKKEYTDEDKLEFEKNAKFIKYMLISGIIFIFSIILRVFLIISE